MALGPPGTEEGGQGHLGVGAPRFHGGRLWFERVPPLILRLITRGRRLRSAALLSGATSGSATKTKSSPYQVRGRLLRCLSMRRHSLPWTANGSSRQGRQRASRRFSKASWAARRCFPEVWLEVWLKAVAWR